MMAPASKELQKELEVAAALDAKKRALLAANKKAAQAILLSISLQLGSSVVSTTKNTRTNERD